MKQLFSIVFFLCGLVSVFGQSEIVADQFVYNFIPTRKGATIVYENGKRYFSIVLKGNVKEVSVDGEKAENQNFISVDNRSLGLSIIPITENMRANYNLSNLSLENQKAILKSYLDYEVNYFQNMLKVDLYNLKAQTNDINSKQFLFYYFDMAKTGFGSEFANRQLYLCSIQFDRILVINLPLLEGDSFEDSSLYLKKMAKEIKSYNKKFNP